MDTQRSRERGFAPVLAIGIFALIVFVFGGAIMYAGSQERVTLSTDADQGAEQSPKKAQTASSLRSELEMAIKSGGIHPLRFNDIEREINALAATGADVSELRTLLSKLAVGSETAPKPTPPPPPQQPAEVVRTETKPYWEYNPSKTENWHYWAREGSPPA